MTLSETLEDSFWVGPGAPALVRHVIASGRSYVQHSPENGEMVEQLAADWTSQTGLHIGQTVFGNPPAWLWPVRRHVHTVGLIMAGEMPEDVLHDSHGLEAIGHFLDLCWSHVDQAEALEIARRTDRTSGVLNRAELTAVANRVIQQSIADNEPVVVLTMLLEGVRRLDDKRQWAERDRLVQQIGQAMRQRLRSDDLIGRFSDDHFVVVLRRLDVALGKLIAEKLLESVNRAIVSRQAVKNTVAARCVLTEAGSQSFESALGTILDALQQARYRKTDLFVATPAVTPPEKPAAGGAE